MFCVILHLLRSDSEYQLFRLRIALNDIFVGKGEFTRAQVVSFSEGKFTID